MLKRRSMLHQAACWAALLSMPVMIGARTGWCADDPEGKPAAGAERRDDRQVDDRNGGDRKDDDRKNEDRKDEDRKPEAEARRFNSVPLEFCETIDSRKAKRGDSVHLKVTEDTIIDGKLRFRRDAEAMGFIEDVEKPGRFGKKAVIRMRLDWVKDVNGEHVPLQSYSTGHRFNPGAGGASLGGALFFGPLGLLGGALVKGGHVQIKKGTRIQARLLRPEEKKAKEKE